MPGRVTVDKIQDFTVQPFVTGNLEVNGVQYSEVYNASTSNAYISTNSGDFNVIPHGYPGGRGYIKQVDFGLTARFQGNSTTRMDYKWQARNLIPLAAAWVDIKPDEESDLTTSWGDETVSGRATAQAGFNSVPFEVRMQFRTNNADLGIAALKSSSYIRCLYEID